MYEVNKSEKTKKRSPEDEKTFSKYYFFFNAACMNFKLAPEFQFELKRSKTPGAILNV